MLKHQLIHPVINNVIGRAGHHSLVLVADGNYPASAKCGPRAEVVCLNLTPGVVNCVQVFEALLSAIPVECINIMGIPEGDPYAKAGEPPVWAEYRRILKKSAIDLALEPIQKWDFYKKVTSEDHVLTIQTGEQALWANVLLTIGCRQG